MALTHAVLLIALASQSCAQFGGFGNGNNPSTANGNGNNNNNGIFNLGSNNADRTFFSSQRTLAIAHAVLACLVFGFIFPAGGIVIRLTTFKGAWILHGLCQLFGYLLYIAAAAMGIYMAVNLELMNQAHAIIGIVLLISIFIQPFTGLLHHAAFKKHFRRTIPSFVHVWLGRAGITLGIINGGLGLQLARKLPFARPSRGAIVGYSVIAGFMWMLYVVAVIVGESRRSRAAKLTTRDPKSPGSSPARRNEREVGH